jgi:hypothetical protein
MKTKNLIILFFGMVFLIEIASAIPQTFNVHGKLTDSDGSALSGTYTLNFTIYDSYEAGSTLWSSGDLSITSDSEGIYNLILTAIDLNFSEQYYLGVTVEDDDEMTPRINLTSSPYTFRANVSDYLEASRNYYVNNLNATTDVCLTSGVCLSSVSSSAGGWTKTGTEVALTTATDNVSIGSTPTLFVDSTNNRVGIGTSTPFNLFNVIGDGNFTGTLYANAFIGDGSGLTGISFGRWNVSGSNFYPESLSYNVGIGTASPSAKLEIYEVGSSNALLQIHNAPKGSDCPENMSYIDKGNMSYIDKNGGYCIDQYEAVAMNSDGTWNESSDDNGWVEADTASLLVAGGYAGSMGGHYPWVYVSQNQAKIACENAGKHLCSSDEWMGAANIGGEIYNLDATISACTVSRNCVLGNGLGPNGGNACYGGAMTGCVSAEGVYDMTGNVWEWTNEIIDEVISPSGGEGYHYINSTDLSYSTSTSADDGTYGKDRTYFSAGTTTNKAVRRGGYWITGAAAGPFCSNLGNGAAGTGYGIGFRCCSVPN